MNRKIIGLLALVAVLALAGCTTGSGLDPQEAVNGSEAVASISTQGGSQPSVQLTLEDTVRKNDHECHYSVIFERTVCNSNWQKASVEQVNVTRANSSSFETFDASAGETISIPVPSEDASYKASIESANQPDTYFRFNVSVENGNATIVSGGYDDQY